MKILNRIKKSDEFAATIHKGNSFRLPSFIVHVKNNDLSHTRVGISASKKLGNAVTRNRVKRQVRAMCDSLINYDAHSLDIVIVVRSKFLEMSFDENKSQLCDFVTKQVGL